jgi:TorA maturation chaperone TorD
MIDIALHTDTPPQHSPSTATASAPAVTSYTDKDLYTDFTDATDCFIGKNPCFPCTSVYQKHYD